MLRRHQRARGKKWLCIVEFVRQAADQERIRDRTDFTGHFVRVFEEADVDAALAATVFHSGQIPIPNLKQSLADAGIEVRPC